jgi:ribose transport system substrate-binding protein
MEHEMKFSCRKTIAILLVGSSLLGLESCSQTDGSTGKPQIAVVISTLNNPWFVVLGDAAKKRAEELGYAATIYDSKNDPATEAATIDSIISRGFKAILFNPTDSDASIPNVSKAKAAGIPVFCIDREINTNDAATSQILSDSYAGCVKLGQYFVEQVGEKGNYAELLGIEGDNNTKNRSEGFHSVVDQFAGLKCKDKQNANFDREEGAKVMASILQADPDIVAVFCGNDAMALGAYRALLAAGKDKQVKVFGFDGADEVVKLVGEKKIAATAMQFPKKMARTAAEFADQWIKGDKRDFDQKILVGVELVTPDNVGEYGDYGSKEEASK